MNDLLASENRLRILLGRTQGIVFEFDRDARYLDVWTHDESLLARPADELVGRTIIEVLGEANGRPFTDAIRRVFDSGVTESLDYELEVQGGRRWFIADVIKSPSLLDREQTVVYFVRDVTTHKLVEEQLRQAQKMEAIGQLAGGIAHDFNNILTTIRGYSELLLEGFDDTSQHHRYAAKIRHAAERASALTSQLLAHGRKRMLLPEVLDANAVIANMGDMLRRLIGEHIELRIELDPALDNVELDRGGLEQIIMNLAVNARDALGKGGVLSIRTETVGDEACIVVGDSGDGMDAVTKSHIFEPFFTTKEVGKGTGLGLSTVYGIVRQSNGRIDVESSLGSGSVFRVCLPRVRLPVPKKPTGEIRARSHPGATVLVVEDDLDVRQLIDHYLSSAGYEVILADDGNVALDVARESRIDLLVTDVVMPRMGGDVLARELRALQPAVRVLYVSGYPDDSRRSRLPRVSDSAFLQKPFSKTVLVDAVGSLFQKT